MQIPHLGDDWRSARVPRTLGTGYPQPGQGPVSQPAHRPTLPDPGAQPRFGNSHLYVEGTAHGRLFTMLTSGPLGQVCKTIVLPPLCICGGNDLSYLNHIIIAHYNASYGCGKCLKQAFMSSSALYNHKKVCLGFVAKKPAAGSDSKPSSGRGSDGSHSGPTRATPKKEDSKAPAMGNRMCGPASLWHQEFLHSSHILSARQDASS